MTPRFVELTPVNIRLLAEIANDVVLLASGLDVVDNAVVTDYERFHRAFHAASWRLTDPKVVEAMLDRADHLVDSLGGFLDSQQQTETKSDAS